MEKIESFMLWLIELGSPQRIVFISIMFVTLVVQLIPAFFLFIGVVFKGDAKKYTVTQKFLERPKFYQIINILSMTILLVVSFAILVGQPYAVAAEKGIASEQTVTAKVTEIISADGYSAEFKTDNGDHLYYYTRSVAHEVAGGKDPAEIASLLIEGDTVKYTYHLNYNDISFFTGLTNVPDDERDKLIQELELIER